MSRAPLGPLRTALWKAPQGFADLDGGLPRSPAHGKLPLQRLNCLHAKGHTQPPGSLLLPRWKLFFGTGCPQTPQDPQPRPTGKGRPGGVPRRGAGQHCPLRMQHSQGCNAEPSVCLSLSPHACASV